MSGTSILDRLYPERVIRQSGVIVKVSALPARLLPELVEFFDSPQWLEISTGSSLAFGPETYPLLLMLEQSVQIVGGTHPSIQQLPPEIFPEVIETMVSLSLSLGTEGGRQEEEEGGGESIDQLSDDRSSADKLRDTVGRLSVFLCNHGHPFDSVREYPLSRMLAFIDDLTGKKNRDPSPEPERHQTQAERFALMQAMNKGLLFNG